MCRRILGPAPLEVDGIARAVGVYARAEEYDWGDAQADEDACPVVEDLIRKLDMERCYRRSEEAKWQDTEQQLRQQVQSAGSTTQMVENVALHELNTNTQLQQQLNVSEQTAYVATQRGVAVTEISMQRSMDDQNKIQCIEAIADSEYARAQAGQATIAQV